MVNFMLKDDCSEVLHCITYHIIAFLQACDVGVFNYNFLRSHDLAATIWYR